MKKKIQEIRGSLKKKNPGYAGYIINLQTKRKDALANLIWESKGDQ